MKHIAFTGGGSGGHVTPIASLIEYGLQDTDIVSQCKLFRFGEASSLEEQIAHSFGESVTFVPLLAGKLRRYRGVQAVRANIVDMVRGISGFFQAVRLLKKYHIDHVFCKGGHVALPVCMAAYVLRIPIVVHESDTYGGMANRVVTRMATKVFTGFPETFGQGVVIGQLLSPRLLHPLASFFADAESGGRTVVLVMGGSQGATTLFEFLLAGLEEHLFDAFHFIVLLGTKNALYEQPFQSYTNVSAYTFITEPEYMAELYRVSDISITRGSATSLAEQHAFGIQKLIVPTPYTGGNHQYFNGLRYEKQYGDRCIEQKEGFEELLQQELLAYTGYKKQATHPDESFITGPLSVVWKELLKV